MFRAVQRRFDRPQPRHQPSRCLRGWFERNHLPRPENAAPAASFGADAFGLQVPIQETGSLSLVDDNRPEAAADVSVD